MNTTIWKLPLPGIVNNVILPKGAEIIHADEQDGQHFLWALVDPSTMEDEMREIHIVGTGNHLCRSFSKEDHISTILSETGIVWHVFEVK